MTTFTNTDTSTRVWPSLEDPATHRTLQLAPGESVDLDIPVTPEIPYLTPVKSTKAPKAAPVAVAAPDLALAKADEELAKAQADVAAATATTPPQVAAPTKE